jgi:hypothetical protein
VVVDYFEDADRGHEGAREAAFAWGDRDEHQAKGLNQVHGELPGAIMAQRVTTVWAASGDVGEGRRGAQHRQAVLELPL